MFDFIVSLFLGNLVPPGFRFLQSCQEATRHNEVKYLFRNILFMTGARGFIVGFLMINYDISESKVSCMIIRSVGGRKEKQCYKRDLLKNHVKTPILF